MNMKLFVLAGLSAVSAGAMAQNPNSTNSAQYHAIRNPGSPYSPYSNAQQQPSLPPVKWADRWGAIADDGRGVAGAVTDFPSKQEARSAALVECEKRGGGACVVRAEYKNQCAVIIAGDVGSSVANAATIERATELGMKGCKERGNANCWTYYSGCSMPVQVQ